MENLEEITFEVAVDIGLIPKPDFSVRLYSGVYPFEGATAAQERRELANLAYKRWYIQAVNHYCFDRDLMLCRFPRKRISEAIRRKNEKEK